MAGQNRNDIEYLHPILQQVVLAKRELGLRIHLPNFEPVPDEKAIGYIETLFEMLNMHLAKPKDRYPAKDDTIILAAFGGDRERASREKLRFFHNVSGCHPDIILYIEQELRKAGKTLPKKPRSLSSQTAA